MTTSRPIRPLRKETFPPSRGTCLPLRAFTLIELILVMAILAAVLAISAPALGRFFRGRNLDSEAYRILALSRHAQNRAVSEGIPMILWIDLPTRRYGLQADPTWSRSGSGAAAGPITSLPLGTVTASRAAQQNDPKSVEFSLAEDVEIEVQRATFQPTLGSLDIRENITATRFLLRFQADGFLPAQAPEWILIRPRNQDEPDADRSRLWIAPGINRMAYEIWTNQPPVQQR